jgi:hypothetical protein
MEGYVAYSRWKLMDYTVNADFDEKKEDSLYTCARTVLFCFMLFVT